MNFRYLIVEGPIGSGKTTLAENLAVALQAETLLDSPWTNPHLEDFYENRAGAAFRAQLYFLAERVTLLKELTRHFPQGSGIISDFLLEKDKVFAFLNLTDPELDIYKKLYDAFSEDLVQPDLIIQLKAPVEILMGRIHGRNKPMERHITHAYLTHLIEAYDHFFTRYHERTRIPLLIIPSARIDFTSQGEELDDLVRFLKNKPVTGLQFYSRTARG